MGSEVKVGQVWRRRHDSREIRIVRIHNVSLLHEKPYFDVLWHGVGKPGTGALFEDSLRKRYDLVEEAPDAQ